MLEHPDTQNLPGNLHFTRTSKQANRILIRYAIRN